LVERDSRDGRLLFTIEFEGRFRAWSGELGSLGGAAPEIAAKIAAELAEGTPGTTASVHIHFREGSLVWTGIVAFFAVAEGISASVELYRYTRRIVSWVVDREVADRIGVPREALVGSTQVTAPPTGWWSLRDDPGRLGVAAVLLGGLAVATALAALVLAGR
jgi:hypothetical protein